MKAKSKGSAAERELLKLLWERGWGVVRIAGSGSMPLPCPDLLAGKPFRSHYSIEVKATKMLPKYISKAQIKDLKTFATRFNAKPLIAVKINYRGWHFLYPSDLDQTEKSWVITEKIAQRHGFGLDFFK